MAEREITGKLLFWRPAEGSGKLVFGDAPGGEVVPDAEVSLDAGLPELDGQLTLRAGALASIDAELPGLDAEVALGWDANASRNLLGWTVDHWQDAAPAAAVARPRWHISQPAAATHRPRWQQAAPAGALARPHWQQSLALRIIARPAFEQGQPVQTGLRAGFQQAIVIRAGARSLFESGEPLLQGVRGRFQETLKLRAGARLGFEVGQPVQAIARGWLRAALPLHAIRLPRWQEAMRPLPGRSQRPVPPIGTLPPCYDPARLGLLVFERAFSGDGELLFICRRPGSGGGEQPPATVVVLPRRTYIVINEIEIRRADSAELLPAQEFSATLDRDSWTWSFTATFERSARASLAPDADGLPVELEARINGQPLRLQAERLGRSIKFPERLVKVSGRGKAALLDEPYAPQQSFGNAAPRTAQQLMLDVLTINGVSNGWSVDWQLTDWLVPANVWLHQGTWISALADIAASAGGYLQPHDTAPLLRVLPAWPKPWWDWGSAVPDLELPAGIAEVEETEWIDKPAYDRIFISGQAGGGILGDYKRAGTAGAVLRPMAVHPLITDEAAARQRAIAELSDSGRLINQTLTLQVLPETGVIKPGALLRYTDDDGAPRLGLVRSTALNWSFPVLTQTIGIEGHA